METFGLRELPGGNSVLSAGFAVGGATICPGMGKLVGQLEGLGDRGLGSAVAARPAAAAIAPPTKSKSVRNRRLE